MSDRKLPRQVLIIDAEWERSRVVAQILRATQEYHVSWTATHEEGGMLLEALSPSIVFVELKPPRHEGLLFTKELRLSDLACRKVPVIMLASKPTEMVIRAARDSGVNEFLRSPFSVRDLMLRVEAVTQKQRPWIEAVNYVGPDRRRVSPEDYSGLLRRRTDLGASSTADTRVAEALRLIMSALDAIPSSPRQALRSLHAQADALKAAAASKADHTLARGAEELKAFLDSASRTGVLSRELLIAHTSELMAGSQSAKAIGGRSDAAQSNSAPGQAGGRENASRINV